MLSKRVRFARAHLSRKKYTELLAKPRWRLVDRVDLHGTPHPFSVSQAAMKARPSKRIKIMAQPKLPVKKYDPAKASPRIPRIHPKTLNAKLTKRIADLALPKTRLVLAARGFYAGKKLTIVNNTLAMIKKSRYRKYRVICSALEQQAAAREEKIRKRLRKFLSKPSEWERHYKYLETLAAPKKIPKPAPPLVRRKKGKINPRRLSDLANPITRFLPFKRDPFRVPKAALVYKTTARMVKLAERPERVIIEPKIPGRVAPMATKAVASPRITELAKHRVRPPGKETDLKEDAFSVAPMALKAWCSPRLKKLARPKTYGKKK